MLKKIMLNIADWIVSLWVIIQELFGAILVCITNAKKHNLVINDQEYEIFIASRFNENWAGVSLGDFIVFAKENFVDEISVKHEYGHRKQSLILGPLYLILIGIPSAIGNIWDRAFHANWSCLDRICWYYTLPWEQWADKIAGITLEDRGF